MLLKKMAQGTPIKDHGPRTCLKNIGSETAPNLSQAQNI
jgi:hypothetical protein